MTMLSLMSTRKNFLSVRMRHQLMTYRCSWFQFWCTGCVQCNWVSVLMTYRFPFKYVHSVLVLPTGLIKLQCCNVAVTSSFMLSLNSCHIFLHAILPFMLLYFQQTETTSCHLFLANSQQQTAKITGSLSYITENR
jgi:hypothetical protein